MDEDHLHSLVESNKPFAQRGARSRQDPSSSAVSTPPMSAGSSAVADSPILLPAAYPSSTEVPSGVENQMLFAGRSRDVVALGVSGSPPTLSGEAAGGVSTTTSEIGGGGGTATGTATAVARRKPVPSLVPPPVLVTVERGEMENEWDVNGNVSYSALSPPLPRIPLPSLNHAYLSPSDAEGGRRWSGSYSDDTLAVMEEQRRKRAVLHRRHQGTPEPEPEPDEKGVVEVVEVVRGGMSARLKGSGSGGGIIPFPARRDSLGKPPGTTQRQLLQATGASARRKREQVRDSTYTNGTKNTNGSEFKGCTSPPSPFLLCFVSSFCSVYPPVCCVWRIRTDTWEGLY
jgi:hypothetical protein